MKIRQKQIIFIKALLTESTITKACEKASISRVTAYKYLNDEDFKRELNKHQAQSINETSRFLQGQLSECNDTLMQIIRDKNTSPQIKINAINTIYNNCYRFSELTDVINRLEEIERNCENIYN